MPVHLALAHPTPGDDLPAAFTAVHFVACAVVLLVVTVSAGWVNRLVRLPQLLLLLPVAAMSLLGGRWTPSKPGHRSAGHLLEHV